MKLRHLGINLPTSCHHLRQEGYDFCTPVSVSHSYLFKERQFSREGAAATNWIHPTLIQISEINAPTWQMGPGKGISSSYYKACETERMYRSSLETRLAIVMCFHSQHFEEITQKEINSSQVKSLCRFDFYQIICRNIIDENLKGPKFAQR